MLYYRYNITSWKQSQSLRVVDPDPVFSSTGGAGSGSIPPGSTMTYRADTKLKYLVPGPPKRSPVYLLLPGRIFNFPQILSSHKGSRKKMSVFATKALK